jgi:hypothetical protein
MPILWPRIRIWIRHKKFRMRIRIRIRPNDADPCGSGSRYATLLYILYKSRACLAEPHYLGETLISGKCFLYGCKREWKKSYYLPQMILFFTIHSHRCRSRSCRSRNRSLILLRLHKKGCGSGSATSFQTKIK